MDPHTETGAVLTAGPTPLSDGASGAPRSALNGFWTRTAPFVAFAALVVAVYADPLFTRRNFGGRDIVGFDLPIEKRIHDAYAGGHWPVWFPDISGGRPLLANPNAGAFYPMRPALSLLPFPLAMRIFPLLHWCLAGFGVLLWCRSSGRSRAGSWVAAATYVFSGASVTEVFYSNIQPGFALLPWVAWTMSRPARRFSRIVAVATAFGLLFLVGDVFLCILAVACALVWIAREESRDVQVRRALDLGVSLALAGLLAAPQILASALWVPFTNRAILGMRLRETFLYSTSPLRLFEFVVPYLFGPTWSLESGQTWAMKIYQNKTVGFFSTLYAGTFAALAPFLSRRESVRGSRFSRAVLVGCLALAVLPSLVPASLGTVVSPLPLRYPEKFSVGAVLALAFVAGVAFDRVRREGYPGRALTATGAVFAALALITMALPAATGRAAAGLVGSDAAAAVRAGQILPGALAEAGLLWMATLVALELCRRQARAGAIVAAAAILAAVPVAANRRIAQTFSEDQIFGERPFVRVMNRADPRGHYRTLGEWLYRPHSPLELPEIETDPGQIELSGRHWEQYAHALWNRGTIFNVDFDHGDLSRLESLRGLSWVASTYLASAPFWGSIGLRWGVRYNDQQAIGGYRPVRTIGRQTLDEHTRAYPDVRLLERWLEQPGIMPAANAIPRLAEGEVVLETQRAARQTARRGSLRVAASGPEGFRARVETPDPTWLFVVRGFWPYRRVRIDGAAVAPVAAQVAFSAVAVPAGRHEIVWEEIVPGGTLSRWGPVLFAVAAAALLAAGRRERPA